MFDSANIPYEVAGALRCGAETVNSVIVVVQALPDLVDSALSKAVNVVHKARIPNTGKALLLAPLLPIYFVSTEPESMGAALLSYTGPVSYRKCVCAEARYQGLKLNAAGLWKGKERIAGRTEEQILTCLGLPWTEPKDRKHFSTTRRRIQKNGPK